jgi:hypothetical protein
MAWHEGGTPGKDWSEMTARERFRELTKRPTIMDAALAPIQKKIFQVVDEKIKPVLEVKEETSGRRMLYKDPRIDKPPGK